MRTSIGALRRFLSESLFDPEEAGLNLEIRTFFLQESQEPTGQRGLYAPFDMERDHTGPAAEPWYRSPGMSMGTAGDPGRPEDARSNIGMAGELAPQIWQLSAGSNTGAVLGANARPQGAEAGTGDENEEQEEENGERTPGEEGTGDVEGEDGADSGSDGHDVLPNGRRA